VREFENHKKKKLKGQGERENLGTRGENLLKGEGKKAEGRDQIRDMTKSQRKGLLGGGKEGSGMKKGEGKTGKTEEKGTWAGTDKFKLRPQAEINVGEEIRGGKARKGGGRKANHRGGQ